MKTALLTGGSGFLGKVIYCHLQKTMVVKTIGRQTQDDFRWDLREGIYDLTGIYDLVVHSAGKAHSVPTTEEECAEFFNVNLHGTVNLLKSIERLHTLPKSFIFISTVAVYGLAEGVGVDESAQLNATDPYGRSKIKAEQVIQDWCAKHKVLYAILRLPLIAGPNPPGNLGSMIKGINKGYYLNISGGKARKSVVLSEDVARIIPQAAEHTGIYNLTDGYHPSFFELSELIGKQMQKGKPKNIPDWLAAIVAKVGDVLGSKAPINSEKLLKITSDLTFDDSKARQILKWSPTPVLEGFRIR